MAEQPLGAQGGGTGWSSANDAGATLSIDLGALATNWRMIAARSPRSACAAVVKADAYGLGLGVVVPALINAGCGTFFVAHLEEARRVRNIAETAHIYVLNGLPPGSSQAFAEIEARPVLCSTDEVFEWAGFLRTSGWRGGSALQVDTGMNRLGVSMEQARDLSQAVDRPPFSLIMTHLACAEQATHPLTVRQREAFESVRDWFPSTPASLANSSGAFLPGDPALDLVRPGYALYGGNPTPGLRNPMRNVVTLEARIIQVRTVSPGETVGYGAAWTAKRPTRIAIVSLGYADGYLRSASWEDGRPGAEAAIADSRRPVIGRVSMDMVAVDVTGVSELEARRGGFIQFIGPDMPLDDVANRAGTIGYEFLTRLGQRFHRVIKN